MVDYVAKRGYVLNWGSSELVKTSCRRALQGMEDCMDF